MDVASFVQAPLIIETPIHLTEAEAMEGMLSPRLEDFREEESGRVSMHWTCTAMCVADVLEVIHAITKPVWQIWDVEIKQFPNLDYAKFSWRCHVISLSEMRAHMTAAGPNLDAMYKSLRPYSALAGDAGSLVNPLVLQRTVSAADASEISTPSLVLDFLDDTVNFPSVQ